MAPMTASDVMGIVLLMMGCAFLMYFAPACGHPRCQVVCREEKAKERAIPTQHAFHRTPESDCPLCRNPDE